MDPARRVRLKISHERLEKFHPSDLADILEDLAPVQREAIFNSLDEEVAAEALEEVEPKLQRQLLESIDSERAADIMEEMDPSAAADLLGELRKERSEEILEEMQPEEREEVKELLEFSEHSAAGRMTTNYVAVPSDSTVAQAVEALRNFDDDPETVTEIYLVDDEGVLLGWFRWRDCYWRCRKARSRCSASPVLSVVLRECMISKLRNCSIAITCMLYP